MNQCITLTCNTCEQDIDCRVGYSNRRIQPLAFSCPHCDSALGITLDITRAPQSDFQFDGCVPSDTQANGPFVGSNPFVDLHLDFPVRSGKYEMGRTAFLMAIDDLRTTTGGDSKKAHDLLQHHTLRLNSLNEMSENSGKIKRLINLYHGKNKQLFQRRAADFLGEVEEKSLLPQDVNATLYRVIAKAFFPFTVYAHNLEISREMPQLMRQIEPIKLGKFVDELEATGYLGTLHRDCLKIYPRIFDAELSLRPALFVDLIDTAAAEKTAARVSAQDFAVLKDLYKDIVELLARQLVLVAGFNNLLHRGGADEFAMIDGGALSSLKKFSAKPLAERFKYLDDCWYNLSSEAFDVDLRNAISHNNLDYNGGNQTITYVPGGGRLERGDGKTITLLEFLRLLLISFRELHSLNMVIKSVFFYKFLIHDVRTRH